MATWRYLLNPEGIFVPFPSKLWEPFFFRRAAVPGLPYPIALFGIAEIEMVARRPESISSMAFERIPTTIEGRRNREVAASQLTAAYLQAEAVAAGRPDDAVLYEVAQRNSLYWQPTAPQLAAFNELIASRAKWNT
jgi:hypothetical protein